MALYMDSTRTPAERAKALLAELSMDEKMAQIVGVLAPAAMTEEQKARFGAILENGIGHVSTLNVRMLRSVEEACKWQRDLQARVMAASPHGIPAIFHMEGLSGAFLTGASSFPSGIGRASSFDPALEEKIGEIVGRQERAAGVTQTLAPVLDISRDSRMGRQGETYGEDPTLAAAMGTAYTKGLQGSSTDGRRSDGCAKHFLGFHNSQGGIHGANVDMGRRLTEEVYGKPFQAAIAEGGLMGVMPCYCTLNGEPVSASRAVLTELLRDEMGFEGTAISDYGAVGNVYKFQGIGESMGAAGLRCLTAGMDVELPVPEAFQGEMKGMIEADPEAMRALDQAVLRVLTAKFRMGLFEHPFAMEGEALQNAFYHDNDARTALQSARESLVLLKNNGALPLKNGGKTIALIGPHAANARSFFGGYTHLSMVEAVHAVANSTAGVGESGSVAGKDYLHVPGTDIQSDETEEFDDILKWVKPGCKSLLEELRERLPDADIRYAHGYFIAGADESGFEEALDAARGADVIVLTLGGKHGSCSVASMGEGVDAVNINLPPAQDAFIRKAAKLGKTLIGVHFDGRPISSDAADECLDAIVEAWNPSEAGAQAVVDVLTGAFNPCGKMPVTTARSAGQIPVYYNHLGGSAWHQGDSIGFKNYVDMTHLPRYYFGQGLSYTSFVYEALDVTEKTAPDGTVRVSFSIRNAGNVTGTEVVQLYLRDPHASMARPVMELQGFARVELAAGEARRVTFSVAPSQMAFLDASMRWKIESGEIQVLVGSASNDIRLRGSYQVTDSTWIRGRDRKFYADVKVE